MSDYMDYVKKFNSVWKYMQSISDKDAVKNLCEMRNYYDVDRWEQLFETVGLVYISEESEGFSKIEALKENKEFSELALFSKNGNFLLSERYIVPVKDMLGNVIALIGWYPDQRKYITTPSKYFVRDCLFFGMEQLSHTGLNADYVLVEGIFDSLALRSIGINAVAQMGITTSSAKQINYGLFKKIVAIPDNDKEGRKVIQKDGWVLPPNASYFKWRGKVALSEKEEDEVTIKDIDIFCMLFDESDIQNCLKQAFESKERVITLSI